MAQQHEGVGEGGGLSAPEYDIEKAREDARDKKKEEQDGGMSVARHVRPGGLRAGSRARGGRCGFPTAASAPSSSCRRRVTASISPPSSSSAAATVSPRAAKKIRWGCAALRPRRSSCRM